MNVELEYRNLNELTLVTKDLLKKHPEWVEQLEKYHSISADEGVSDLFVSQVDQTGFIHTPLFIQHIEELDLDVIVAGRKRYLAAKRLGYTEVPTLPYDADDNVKSAVLEVTENFARRDLSIKERAEAYRKLFITGMNQEQVAKLTGMTGAAISQALAVAEMPDFIHKHIDKEALSMTAAYNLARTFGKKAPKASGRQRIYDKETEAAMKDAIDALSEEARLSGKGNGKIKSARFAKDSKAKPADAFTSKNWQAVYDHGETPDDYKALIGLFLNKLSLKQAQSLADGNLDWLERREPAPKPKKVKEPKVKGEKKAKNELSESEVHELFGA